MATRHDRSDPADDDALVPLRVLSASNDGFPLEPAKARRSPAFERLITDVIVSGGPALLRLAASICPAEADDILNTATERVLARPEAFAHGEPARLYRWLETVVRNEALRTKRARGREQPTDPEALAKAPDPSTGADPHAALAATQERIATLEALAELHPLQASCLVLRARGFSRAEIADLLGISPLTVKRRLAEARAALARFGDDLDTGRRCSAVRSLLSDYLDRELDGAELRRTERHLEHCGRCRGQLVALRRQRSRIAAALPSALLVAGGEMAARGGDADLQLTRQLAEAAHDGWVALTGGFLARVVEGWHALSPLGRLAGAGAMLLLALAGIGSFPVGDDAATSAGASRAGAPAAVARDQKHPAPRAQKKPSRPRASQEPSARRSSPGKRVQVTPRADPPAVSGAVGAPAPASPPPISSAAGGSPSAPAAAPAPRVSAAPPQDPARAEFEPGPP